MAAHDGLSADRRAYLRRGGHSINPKRVRRLMRLMRLQAVYPKPRTSTPAPGHKRYPYLLRDPLLASAGLDRLAHRAEILMITGGSFRAQGRRRLEQEGFIEPSQA